jgi:hypothetical protein
MLYQSLLKVFIVEESVCIQLIVKALQWDRFPRFQNIVLDLTASSGKLVCLM